MGYNDGAEIKTYNRKLKELESFLAKPHEVHIYQNITFIIVPPKLLGKKVYVKLDDEA